MLIYEKIIQLCKEKNIAVSKLEKECGLGNGTIKGWKEGSPKVTNIQKVAKYFGITVDELIKEG